MRQTTEPPLPAASALRWVMFDWGGTLMSEQGGPQNLTMARWPQVSALPDAQTVLARIAGHCSIAVATNASVSKRADVEAALARVDLRRFVSRIFCFTELGFRKSQPQFWDHVLRELAVGRGEVVMIGDTFEQDVLGPARYGIASVWLRPCDAPQPPNCAGLSYATICGLAELPVLLGLDN
jgi:FMN phosphatase YigB (HAD superfamily)